MSSHDATPDRVREAYKPLTFQRLLKAKRAYDPQNMFRINHNLLWETLWSRLAFCYRTTTRPDFL